MKQRKTLKDKEQSDRWLLTYADLITLLLGFFVVMYSISRIDSKKFGQMAEGLQGVFSGGESVFQYDSTQINMGSGVLKIGKLKMIQQRIRKLSDQVGKERVSIGGKEDQIDPNLALRIPRNGADYFPVSAEIDERGLVIHVLESALFESGEAELKPQAKSTLDLIANEISGLPNHIRVEGHTDNRPIVTYRYPSNWELSSARATTVVRYLVSQRGFSPDKISALGYGEFRPMAPNNSEINCGKNRRVDIVVLTEELSNLEPTSAIVTKKESLLPGNNLLSQSGN